MAHGELWIQTSLKVILSMHTFSQSLVVLQLFASTQYPIFTGCLVSIIPLQNWETRCFVYLDKSFFLKIFHLEQFVTQIILKAYSNAKMYCKKKPGQIIMFVLAWIWSPITASCSAWQALYDGADSLRLGSRSVFPYVESDGPCLVAGRSARA